MKSRVLNLTPKRQAKEILLFGHICTHHILWFEKLFSGSSNSKRIQHFYLEDKMKVINVHTRENNPT
jgi:hypothetical protein